MRTTSDVRVPPPPDAIDLVAGDAELTRVQTGYADTAPTGRIPNCPRFSLGSAALPHPSGIVR